MTSRRQEQSTPPPRLLAYLQLFRLPNIFTAIADVAMGFLFVQGSPEPWSGFAGLLAASCLLYTAGMVLNDVYDLPVDRQERPSRPLPSGRIAVEHARRLGYGMLVGGVLAAGLTGWFAAEPIIPRWRSAGVASLLAVCVISYDAILKQTALGPLAMGACRFLNVLLGMSLGAQGGWLWHYGSEHLLVAGGVGLYIIGVTRFARSEAQRSHRGWLAIGLGLMVAGLAMLAMFPRFAEGLAYRIEPRTVWPAATFLLSLVILRRCVVAIGDPTPRKVQMAVKQCILSLITLDAALCALTAEWYWAVAVLALWAPALLLGRWVYST